MLTPLLSAEQSLTPPDTAGALVRGCYLFQCVEHIVFWKGGESALYEQESLGSIVTKLQELGFVDIVGFQQAPLLGLSFLLVCISLVVFKVDLDSPVFPNPSAFSNTKTQG